jgi:molybdopterin converting factor small subunit
MVKEVEVEGAAVGVVTGAVVGSLYQRQAKERERERERRACQQYVLGYIMQRAEPPRAWLPP